ncbi:MAG: hypothetical protein O9274_09155 [Limnobacter sp.]|uniref:hypothetical protein n=1 Tax=Limnobacter sp. TaxID=2003368 RepID=UPI0022BC34EC|nr:hypothetical protein [Limnobacter sp.]MCZ8015851.1 hypothetical protein [Limnobacter sp.]
MHKFFYLILLSGLSACASNHDLTQGSNMLGGGYKQDELGPGLFHLYARSNHAPWANYDAARTTWRNGAERACGSAEYDELSVRESERDTGLQNSGGVRYLVTERTGYAKCDSTTLSNEVVSKAVARHTSTR